MVLVQNWPFLHVFIFRDIGQENMFYDIVKQKNVFLACKNKRFKKSKNWDFSKGVSHGFGPKRPFLNFFVLGIIGQENVFYDILERKNAFLCYKSKKLKKLKNGDFSKGVSSWFWSKNGHFSNFFFQAI